jgi:hypothetical protein
MNDRSTAAVAVALALLLGTNSCSAATPPRGGATAPPYTAASCLPGERGFFQASLRGALDVKPDWRGAQLQCTGGARPDARGLRLSFGATLPNSNRTLRIVFGIAVAPGVLRSAAVPANITVIVEGENRIYSTLGDNKCTVEALVQEQLPESKDYRVAARGFCTAPAVAIGGTEQLYIDRFDFAGRAQWEERDIDVTTSNL